MVADRLVAVMSLLILAISVAVVSATTGVVPTGSGDHELQHPAADIYDESVKIQLQSPSQWSTVSQLLQKLICPYGCSDFVLVGNQSQSNDTFFVKTPTPEMMFELEGLPQWYIAATIFALGDSIKVPITFTLPAKYSEIQARGPHQVLVVLNCTMVSYEPLQVLDLNGFFTGKLGFPNALPGTSEPILTVVNVSATLDIEDRSLCTKYVLSCRSPMLQVAIVGSSWASQNVITIPVQSASLPSWVAVDSMGVSAAFSPFGNRFELKMTALFGGLVGIPQFIEEAGALSKSGVSNSTLDGIIKELGVEPLQLLRISAKAVDGTMMQSFTIGSTSVPVDNVSWSQLNTRLTSFLHITHSPVGACEDFSGEGKCEEWCSFNENTGGCCEHQNADATCFSYSGQSECDGKLPKCAHCNFDLCLSKTSGCPQTCSAIRDKSRCEYVKRMDGKCRWSGIFCTASVCFSFLQEGYEVMPTLTFVVAVFKASAVLFCWSAASPAVLLWYRRKRNKRHIDVVATDEAPMMKGNSSLAPLVRDPNGSFDDYVYDLLRSNFGVQQPSAEQMDVVAFVLTQRNVLIAVNREAAEESSTFVLRTGALQLTENSLWETQRLLPNNTSQANCPFQSIENNVRQTQQRLTPRSAAQAEATFHESLVSEYINRFLQNDDARVRDVFFVASASAARRIQASVSAMPSLLMLNVYIAGALLLLTISIVEAAVTLQRYDVFTQCQLVGFRMMNSSLMASFMMVSSKWLHVGYLRLRSRPRKLFGRTLLHDRRHAFSPSQRLGVRAHRRLRKPHVMMFAYFFIVMPMLALAVFGMVNFGYVPLACFAAAVFVSTALRLYILRLISLIPCCSGGGTQGDTDADAQSAPSNTSVTGFVVVEESEGEKSPLLLSSTKTPLATLEAAGNKAVESPFVSAARAFFQFLMVDLVWSMAGAIAFQMGYNYAVMWINAEQMELEKSSIPRIEWDARTVACLEYIIGHTMDEVASTMSHRAQIASILIPFV